MDWTDDYNALMSTILGKPKYKHDCKKCEYKGSTNKFDVYVCRGSGSESDTLIARYGDDGPEYNSFNRKVFARVIADHINGDVMDVGNELINDPKIPHWMLAVLRIAFGRKE